MPQIYIRVVTGVALSMIGGRTQVWFCLLAYAGRAAVKIAFISDIGDTAHHAMVQGIFCFSVNFKLTVLCCLSGGPLGFPVP